MERRAVQRGSERGVYRSGRGRQTSEAAVISLPWPFSPPVEAACRSIHQPPIS